MRLIEKRLVLSGLDDVTLGRRRQDRGGRRNLPQLKKGAAKKRGYGRKVAALSLAGRGGEVRSFKIGGATRGGNRCR